MLEHLQSDDQTSAPEGSAWQAMPHISENGCNRLSVAISALEVYDRGRGSGLAVLTKLGRGCI